MLNTFFTAEINGAAIVVVTFGYVCYFYIEHEGQPGYWTWYVNLILGVSSKYKNGFHLG